MSKGYQNRAYESLIKGYIDASLDLSNVTFEDSFVEEYPPHVEFRKRGGQTTFRLTGANLLEYVLKPVLETDVVTKAGANGIPIRAEAQQELSDLLQEHSDKNQADIQQKQDAIQELQGYFDSMAQARQQAPDLQSYDRFRDNLRQVLYFVHNSLYPPNQTADQKLVGTVMVERVFTQPNLSSLYKSVKAAKKRLDKEIKYYGGIDPATATNPSFQENLNLMKSASKKLKDGLEGAMQYEVFAPKGAMTASGMSNKPLGLDIEAIAKALYFQQ